MSEEKSLNGTPRSKEALLYLNRVKPYDGWSLDTFLASKGRRVKVLRRNVPVSDSDFEDVALDTLSCCVVGIDNLSTLKSVTVQGKEKLSGRGVVLIEKNGTIARKPRTIPIALSLQPKSTSSTSNPKSTKINRPSSHRPPGTRQAKRRANRDEMPTFLNDPEIMKYIFYGVGAIVALKIIVSVLTSFLIIGIPIFFVAQSTLPADTSFDAKKELKRVLRGVHLPESHPDKPKNWLEKTVSRVTASVATELATSLGYELEFTHFFGIATLAAVKVDVASVQCFWIGAFNKWFYIMQRDYDD